MLVINLDEKKLYEFDEEISCSKVMFSKFTLSPYLEKQIYNMIYTYFYENYSEDYVETLYKNMLENIKITINENSIFLFSKKVLYYIDIDENGLIQFVTPPENFIKLKKDVKKVYKNCFDECNANLTKIMQNINLEAGWKVSTFDTMYLGIRKDYSSDALHIRYKYYYEDLEFSLAKKKNFFIDEFKVYLKERLCIELSSEVLDLYTNILLKNNPIIVITNFDNGATCTLDNSFRKENVSFFSILTDLENIISDFIPDNKSIPLINNIYNNIIYPNRKFPKYIRLKNITKYGLSGYLYTNEKIYPLIMPFGYKGLVEFLTIIEIESNESMLSIIHSGRYTPKIGSRTPRLKATEVFYCLDMFTKIDKSFLPESGYIEDYTEYITENLEGNFIYSLKNGELYEVFKKVTKSIYDPQTDRYRYMYLVDSNEYKEIKKFYKEEENKLHYAFVTMDLLLLDE